MMKTMKFLTVLCLAAGGYSCKPRPLQIEVGQAPPALTLSSAAPNSHTILVSAGYSINSMIKLNEQPTGSVSIPEGMLLKDGVLKVSKTGGFSDTLYPLSDGLYGNANIPLEDNATYTIQVFGKGKGCIGMATTIFHARPDVSCDEPEMHKLKGDTSVSFRVKIRNAAAGDYYFISYNTTANARRQAPGAAMDVSTLASFTPKQLALIEGVESRGGFVEKKITLQVRPGDTLLVQTAKVDRAYFDYLTAYKRSGALINQLTGEPVNMPSNVVGGLGFFSLFDADRKVFYLEGY